METGGEIRLGSALFTLVEPHRGHEIEYNRWYERDHFYAGCIVGPWLFAGGRWVATRKDKKRRGGSRPDLFGEDVGTYLSIYFVIDGKHDEHFDWGLRQVLWLHENGRMFAERDHIHTLLYSFGWGVGRDRAGVPPELALDHPYSSLVVQVVQRGDGVEGQDLQSWFAPRSGDTSGIGQTLLMNPILLDDTAPVSQSGMDGIEQRSLLLRFGDVSPKKAASQVEEQAVELADSGLGEVLWSSPFRPTIPGTDTYTDQLW
jgi:hypothetical protein